VKSRELDHHDEVEETQETHSRLYDLRQAGRGLFEPSFVHQPLFERDREGDEGVARIVGVDPLFDLGEPFVFPALVVCFTQVDEVDDRFGGEQHHGVDDVDLETKERKDIGQQTKPPYSNVIDVCNALDKVSELLSISCGLIGLVELG
jgi:hypothetical protein